MRHFWQFFGVFFCFFFFFFWSGKLLFSLEAKQKERLDWGKEDDLLPCIQSWLALFMTALWMCSALCSLYPKQSNEGQEFLGCAIVFEDICVSYNFIFWLYIITVIIIIIKITGGPVCSSCVFSSKVWFFFCFVCLFVF